MNPQLLDYTSTIYNCFDLINLTFPMELDALNSGPMCRNNNKQTKIAFCVFHKYALQRKEKRFEEKC